MDINGPVVKAGAFVMVQGQFPFTVGPTRAGDRLGVVRLGGHREGVETAWECATREVLEEASIRIRPLRPPATYWVNAGSFDPLPVSGGWAARAMPPLAVVRHGVPFPGALTVLYLASSGDTPVPAGETRGLLLPDRAAVSRLSRERMTLGQYLAAGGQALLREEFPLSLPLEPFYHLRLLARVLAMHPELAAC